MASVTFYDAEFLTAPGAPQRFWCGPGDPDPLTIQLGAVRLSLAAPFELSAPVAWFVRPVDRFGQMVPVDALVTRLTGITDDILAREAITLTEALGALGDFAGDDMLMAWGKDELLTIAASLFVQGAVSPVPATRFCSAVPLLRAAGESDETIGTLRSNTLCAHVGIDDPGTAHDAAGDALSVATAFRHLLQTRRLTREDFAMITGA